MTAASGHKVSRSKAPDTRPARMRYWKGDRLRKTKIKHLMRSNGMTRAHAEEFWDRERGGRRMKP